MVTCDNVRAACLSYWMYAILGNTRQEVLLWHHNPKLSFWENRKPWHMPRIPAGTIGFSIQGLFDDFGTNAQKPIETHGLNHFNAVLRDTGSVQSFRSYIAISSRDNGELFVNISPAKGANIFDLFKRTRKACSLLQAGKFKEPTP